MSDMVTQSAKAPTVHKIGRNPVYVDDLTLGQLQNLQEGIRQDVDQGRLDMIAKEGLMIRCSADAAGARQTALALGHRLGQLDERLAALERPWYRKLGDWLRAHTPKPK